MVAVSACMSGTRGSGVLCLAQTIYQSSLDFDEDALQPRPTSNLCEPKNGQLG